MASSLLSVVVVVLDDADAEEDVLVSPLVATLRIEQSHRVCDTRDNDAFMLISVLEKDWTKEIFQRVAAQVSLPVNG